MSRKNFLRLTASAAVAATLTPVLGSDRVRAGTLAAGGGFTTIAIDRNWSAPGSPSLFGATGISQPTHKLAEMGLSNLNVANVPHSGPFMQAWMFGGHVQDVALRMATIELVLDDLHGYHFVEVGLAQLYPYDFFDASPVYVERPIAPGAITRRHAVPRLAELPLPRVTINVVAMYGGNMVSGFALELPHFHARPL